MNVMVVLGLVVWGMGLIQEAHATDILVPNDYTTIAEAITAASNGDTIIVSGTITEAGISVNKSVTIKGDGTGNTIVQAAASQGTAPNTVFLISLWNGTVTISDMTIRYGKKYGGGGITISDIGASNTLNLVNCIFSKNNSTNHGGGIQIGTDQTVNVTNCTFNGNAATNKGGAIYNDGTLNVYNSILWGNTATVADNEISGSATVQNSIVKGGFTGGTDADPLFVSTTDFHLESDSPAIDAGNNSAPNIPSTDLDGNTRMLDGKGNCTKTVDMGAYEASVAIDPVVINSGIDDVTVNEDASNTIIDLLDSFDDPNEEPKDLTYSVQTSPLPSFLNSANITGSDSTNLTLDYKADANGPAADITVRATDQCGAYVEDTFTVTVTAVNDPPSFTKGSDQTADEDCGEQTVSPWATGITKGPTSDEDSQTVTFHIDNDNSGLFASGPSIDSSSGNLTYTPADHANGSADITVSLKDSESDTFPHSNTSASQTFKITVTPVNDAPVLDKSKNPSLTEISEDNFTSDGDTVAKIVIDNSITDVDVTSAPEAIAVTAVNSDDGTWQYDKDGGATFISFPSDISENKAVLLDENAKIRFVPNSNFNGTSAITFRAWDKSSGANGDVSADTTSGTSFSSDDDTAEITVTPVDDSPTVANPISDISASEDSTARTINLSSVFTDIDNNDAGIAKSVSSNNNPGLVSASISGDTLTLSFGSNQNGTATITIRGSSNSKTVDDTFIVTVSAVNDPPSFSASEPPAIDENAPAQTISGWATGFSPGPDSGQTIAAYHVSGISNPGLFSTYPKVDITGKLTYTPAANTSGSSTFEVTVQDNGGSPGISTSPAQTFTITINPNKAQTINFPPLPTGKKCGDHPAFIINAAGGPSGNPVTFTSSNPSVATVTGNAVSITGHGTTIIWAYQKGNENYSDAIPVYQSLVVNKIDQEIIFDELPSTLNINSTVTLIADTETANPSTAPGLPVEFVSKNTSVATIISSNTAKMVGPGTVKICATQPGNPNCYKPAEEICHTVNINGLPVITQGDSVTISMSEDGVNEHGEPDPFSLTLDAYDPNDDTIQWRISIQASYGSASVSGTGPSKDISYIPNPEGNDDIFEVEVSDSKGGTDTITIYVKISNVNDAPLLYAEHSPALTEIQEDETTSNGNTVAEIVVDGSITDVDGTSVEAIAVIQVDNTHGLWQFSENDGASWTDFTTDTRGNIDIEEHARLLNSACRIRFIPDSDYGGEAEFTFRAWDMSSGQSGQTADATVNGRRAPFSSASDTAAVIVNGIDDPPKLVNPILDRTVHEDAHPEFINLADVFMDIDSENTSIVKTIQANTNGTLISATVDGDELTLEYQPDQYGEAVITLLAISGENYITDEFKVTVISENDAPDTPVVNPDQFPTLLEISEDSGESMGNSVAEIFPDDFIIDVDGNTVEAIAVTSVNNIMGVWQYSLDSGLTWQDFSQETGTVALMETEARLLDSDDRIRFIPTPNYYGKSRFTFRAWDMTDGNTPGGTADASDKGGSEAFSLVANEAIIRVNPSDDPPILAHPISDLIVDKADARKTINLTNVFGDPDNDPSQITKMLQTNTNPYLVTTKISDNTLTLEFHDNLLGAATITVLAESNGKNVSDVFTVTVTEEVTDPVGPDPVPPGMTPIDEDYLDSSGDTVADIFKGNFLSEVEFFTDSDGDPIKAIAVTAVNNRIGKWQYSANNGITWNNFSPVEGRFVYMEKKARLLDADHRIRFVPREDYYGRSEFTFRAYDKSVGKPGGTADTLAVTRDEKTGFSAASDNVDIKVHPMDDPPTVENALENIVLANEELPVTRIINLADVFTDIDDDPGFITKSLGSNTNPSLVKAEIDRNTLTLDFQENQTGQADITILGTSNGQTVTDTFTIRAGMPNSAPVLDPAQRPALTSIVPDNFISQGNTVAEIVSDGSVTDADDPEEAIAVISVDNSDGVWRYSIDDGDSWQNFTFVTGGIDDFEAQAVLLDETSRIRFVPDPGFLGIAAFTFRAYDKSAGDTGDTADASINGNETAFSTATNQASIWVSKCVVGGTLPGDIDGSGSVDLADIILTLKLLTEIHTDRICIYADVNDDGKIGMAELVYVLKELSE